MEYNRGQLKILTLKKDKQFTDTMIEGSILLTSHAIYEQFSRSKDNKYSLFISRVIRENYREL